MLALLVDFIGLGLWLKMLQVHHGHTIDLVGHIPFHCLVDKFTVDLIEEY